MGSLVKHIGRNTFRAHERFYIVFVYFSRENLEVEKIWLVPSSEFKAKADSEATKTLRFTASPKVTSKDKWSRFSVEKTELGNELLRLMDIL